MAQKRTLAASVRTEDFGTSGSRRLVRAGKIPAVVYGKTPLHIVLDAKEFMYKKRHFSESTLVELNVDGEDHRVFVKTYQENLLKGIVNHVDFYEVTAGQVVRTHVRIELTGTPAGCKEGGVLDQVVHEVEIECLPKDLPESFVADVSGLALNESLRLDQIAIPSTIKVLADMKETVASVKTVKEEVVAPAADAADAAAAPAIVGADATAADGADAAAAPAAPAKDNAKK